MDELLEKRLIKKASAGNESAFEQLILNYEKPIYAICLRMLGNEQDAYDAAQEVCMKIWRQLHTFKGDSKFSTWLYRIATNQCLDHLRKLKAKKDDISLYQHNQEDGEEWILEHSVQENSLEQYIEQEEMKAVLQKGLMELKDEYREMIVLRDLQGHSYEEMSSILGVSQGTIKSRLSRARLKLRQILTQEKEPYCYLFRQNIKKEDTP